MQNIFDAKDVQQYIDRINLLTPEDKAKMGKNECRASFGAFKCSLFYGF